MFSSAVPVYKVMDLSRTTRWYHDVLGFDGYLDNHSVMRLHRDRVEMLFRTGIPRQHNSPWDTYVRMTGVDTLYNQVRDRAQVRRGPEDTRRGGREIEVRDANGFVLTFGEWNRQRTRHISMYDIHPVLAVDDVMTTVGWYHNVLGFRVDFQGDDFAMLRRDVVTLFFQQADVLEQGRGHPYEWDVYFRVADGQLQTVFDRVKERAVVLRDPEPNDVGQVEFEIEDCNGYVLGFGAQ